MSERLKNYSWYEKNISKEEKETKREVGEKKKLNERTTRRDVRAEGSSERE